MADGTVGRLAFPLSAVCCVGLGVAACAAETPVPVTIPRMPVASSSSPSSSAYPAAPGATPLPSTGKPNLPDPAQGIEVELTPSAPPGLVCRRGVAGNAWELTGEFEVRITNRAKDPRRILQLDVQGLVFDPVKGGDSRAFVHNCSCYNLLVMGDRSWQAVAPGESLVRRFHSFSHDGGPFTPPAPGAYRLRYRVLVGSEKEFPGNPAGADHCGKSRPGGDLSDRARRAHFQGPAGVVAAHRGESGGEGAAVSGALSQRCQGHVNCPNGPRVG